MLSVLGLAAILFASTNLDDLVVLLAFFADPRFRTREIIVGQYVGIAVLTLISVVAALVSLILPTEQVGLLGLLPIVIGLKKLWDLLRTGDEGQRASKPSRASAVLSVAAVTMANGGDNIGAYMPVFATRSAVEVGMVAVVFAAMTALWLFVAHALVRNSWLGSPIRRYGKLVAPFILLGLGAYILHEAGTIHWLMHGTVLPRA